MRVKVLKPFVFALVVMAMVSLACLGSGEAPTSEPPPPPVEEPQQPEQPAAPTSEPTPTEEPTAPAAQEFFTEEFDGDVSNWSQETYQNADEGNLSQVNISVEDGRLIFDLGKWLIGYMFYDPYEYTDVRIDVRVENRGTNVNNVLLVCRASEDEGLYLVNVANSGLFAMYALDVENQNYVRIADGGSNKIKSGKEVNDYALVCKERMLTLYINGHEVRTYTDNKYVIRKGKIGVGVASENQLPVKLEFESVTISEP